MDGALGFPNRQSEVMGNLATMTSCRSLWESLFRSQPMGGSGVPMNSAFFRLGYPKHMEVGVKIQVSKLLDKLLICNGLYLLDEFMCLEKPNARHQRDSRPGCADGRYQAR